MEKVCNNIEEFKSDIYYGSLSKNLSFPLLKELSSRDIPYFTAIFKEELIERIKTGGIKTLRYFIAETDTEESYLKYLSELDLFDNLLHFNEAKIMKSISEFNPLEYTLTTNLRDSTRYTYFRDEKKMHFCLENNYISELEILLDEKSYSDQYHKALLQVKDLKSLEELAIYYSINIHDSGEKTFIKYLDNFMNLSDELRNIVNTFS